LDVDKKKLKLNYFNKFLQVNLMEKFRVVVVNKMADPQLSVYMALHQDYCEDFAMDEYEKFKAKGEKWCGEKTIEYLLANKKGHFGPLEHVQIIFNVGGYPHSMMQQLRTHRVGVSFDVQSFRYTGDRLLDVVEGRRKLEDVMYIRPVGVYPDRVGTGKVQFTKESRDKALQTAYVTYQEYARQIKEGISPEHARSVISFDTRQDLIWSANARSLMHILDLRWKADAQLEIRKFSEQTAVHFHEWMPEIAAWYEENRARRALLSP
jgi:thymidylate synthase (FAD)